MKKRKALLAKIELHAGSQAERREMVRRIIAENHPDLRPNGDMIAALAALPFIAVRKALLAEGGAQ